MPGVRATESEFGAFIARVVEDECGTLTPEECGVEFESPDPNMPFFGIELTPVEPNFLPETEIIHSRPWLDDLDPNQLGAILEQERIERELFELTGGNPVLPETPCELQILNEGPLLGDISGPDGKPDCYVNLFDVVATARMWLKCNNPEDEACFNF